MMEKNDMTFSLYLTLNGKEHLVTAAAAVKEVQRAVDQSARRTVRTQIFALFPSSLM